MPIEPGAAYVDDATIPNEELLYRMIKFASTSWVNGVADRPGTNAFQDRREEDLPELGVPAVAVSVHLESEMRNLHVTPEDLVARWGPEYGVAVIAAGAARANEQGVTRWPTDAHPDHGMIFAKTGAKKTGGQSKNLAKASTVLIPPPPHP